MKPFPALLLLPAIVLALPACQGTREASGPRDNSAAVALLQQVNKQAQACWTRSKDKAFRAYRVIPELDTRVGKPRILLVNAKAAQGLPVYVIEAEGRPARLSAYGPLSSDPIAVRINGDLNRWSSGGTGCTETA